MLAGSTDGRAFQEARLLIAGCPPVGTTAAPAWEPLVLATRVVSRTRSAVASVASDGRLTS